MTKQDLLVLQQMVRFGTIGAFVGMVLVGAEIGFKLSPVGSLLSHGNEPLLANLLLFGSMLKGALVGIALGSANLRGPRSDVVTAPAMVSRPLPAN